MLRTEIIQYLEMTSPEQLRGRDAPFADVRLTCVPVPMPDLNRFFYEVAGRDWEWKDRLSWTSQQWREYAESPNLQTWILSVCGIPAGYAELQRQGESVEIVYFGLLPEFTGKGLGGYALTEVVKRAWEMGPQRVWLHTCNFDHPQALRNYQARGFRIYREESS